MGSSCIITDNAVQFTKVNFPENLGLYFIEYKTEYSLQNSKEKTKVDRNEFPQQLLLDNKPIITYPDVEQLNDIVVTCRNKYDDIYIILHSKELNPTFNTISTIIDNHRGRGNVHLIDSQSISVGQGYLVSYAADLISKNAHNTIIDKELREKVPHIYTVFCTSNLSFLHAASLIDTGQCIVGEMNSLLPIIGLEEGKFNPLDKVKNIHSVIEYFIEFIEEFDDLYQVTFLQPYPPLFSESKLVKQYLEDNYPETIYSDHPINNYLASLLGPKGFGLSIIENN